jgi:quinolinate synthase
MRAECSQLRHCDWVDLTALEEVQNNPAKKFIVATETGIFHQMQKLRPDVTLIQAPIKDKSCACNNCPYMKLNSLEKIKKRFVELPARSDPFRIFAEPGSDFIGSNDGSQQQVNP